MVGPVGLTSPYVAPPSRRRSLDGVPAPRIVSHPVVADLLRQLRDATTPNATFLRVTHQLSRLVAYEALEHTHTVATTVDTPVTPGAPARALSGTTVIVPILRAGLGMTPPVQELLPDHRLCPVGLRRNEATLLPELYHDGLPADVEGSPVIICDPMLATGGSLMVVLDLLRSRNAGDVTALCVLAAQPGVDAVLAAYPQVRIVTAAVDPRLTETGYISPGLGDAGDRLFGPPVHH